MVDYPTTKKSQILALDLSDDDLDLPDVTSFMADAMGKSKANGKKRTVVDSDDEDEPRQVGKRARTIAEDDARSLTTHHCAIC